jgi:hypothetical protein
MKLSPLVPILLSAIAVDCQYVRTLQEGGKENKHVIIKHVHLLSEGGEGHKQRRAQAKAGKGTSMSISSAKAGKSSSMKASKTAKSTEGS